MTKLKTVFYNNQEPIVEDFNYIEDSTLDQLFARYADITTNGVIPDKLNEFDVSAVRIEDNFAVVNVNDGIGYVSGKRIMIKNDSTIWDASRPDAQDIDGVLTPLSTGSKEVKIPFTINNGNSTEKARIFITHLQEVDLNNPAGFEIDKYTYKKQYKYYKDGFVISYALYTTIEPTEPTNKYLNNPFVEQKWIPLADVAIENNNIIINNLIKSYCTLQLDILGKEEQVIHQNIVHKFGISNIFPTNDSILQYYRFDQYITATSTILSNIYSLEETVVLSNKLKYVKCVAKGNVNAEKIKLRVTYGNNVSIEVPAVSLNLDNAQKQIIFDLSSSNYNISGTCTFALKKDSDVTGDVQIFKYRYTINQTVYYTHYDLIEQVNVSRYVDYSLSITPSTTSNQPINDIININFPNPLNKVLDKFLYINGYRCKKFFYNDEPIWEYGQSTVLNTLSLSYQKLKELNNGNEIINDILIYLICTEYGELKFVKTLSSTDVPLARLRIRTLGNLSLYGDYEQFGGFCAIIDKDFRIPLNSLSINRLSSESDLIICPQAQTTTESMSSNIIISPYITTHNIPTKEFKISVEKVNNSTATRVGLKLNNNSVLNITDENGLVETVFNSHLITNQNLFQVVYTNTITTATNSIIIDLNTIPAIRRNILKLMFSCVNTSTTSGRYYLYVNDITTDYTRQSFLVSGTNTTANLVNNSEFLYTSSNNISFAELILLINNQKFLCFSRTIRDTNSLQFFSITNSTSINTFTKIQISFETSANAIGIGSYIILEGLK